jgi:hypothetical protein
MPPELPRQPHGERDACLPHRPACTGRQLLRPLRRGREHVVPQVLEAVAAAIPRGLHLPIVYNTSAYDFWERGTARRLAKAKDYPDRAREAILEMHRQVGVLKYRPDGLARRGVLVRHLVITGRHTRWGRLPGMEPQPSTPRSTGDQEAMRLVVLLSRRSSHATR